MLLLALVTLSAFSFGQNVSSANPGTLNYIEGQVTLNGQQLSSQSVGTAQILKDQTLSTGNGKTEVLLTPGVFLRLGSNTTVKMISPTLTRTEVSIVQGRANVEVDQLYPQNLLLVDVPSGQAHLRKKGLYGFDTANSTIRVFDGEAEVFPGSDLNTNIKPTKIKGGRQLALNGEPGKTQKFDQKSAKDDLYNWSSLRSQYLGEANVDLAENYAGASSFDPGWYWAGGPYGYTWLPGNGLYWSPFGYGFYSPYYIGGGGFIYGRYGRGFWPYGGRPGYGYGYHGGGRPYAGGIPRTGMVGHPGSSGFTHGPAGGFHGGAGGGFHGGGAGGGFHGGGGGGHR
jgi:hypothetical protein